MTVQQAVAQIQNVKPNQYDMETLVRWLSQLDGKIFREVIAAHEGAEIDVLAPYDTQNDMGTELIVPAPFDDLYIKYLGAQVDYHNAEFGRYNNAMVMFNVALADFTDHYNRTHMPKQNNHIKGAN
ncbi:MAG TPA: hypothetical protein DEB31_05480 [Clostridiales bacterium]|nr:hypothetical protein [Clostridiales bacterium]